MDTNQQTLTLERKATSRHGTWDRDEYISGYKWKIVLGSAKALFEQDGERVCVYSDNKEMNIHCSIRKKNPFL